MRRVADEIGVSASSLYGYIANKEALVQLVLAELVAHPVELGVAGGFVLAGVGLGDLAGVMAVDRLLDGDGRHLPEAIEFVKTFALLDRPPPLALASVNLTARKPGKDTSGDKIFVKRPAPPESPTTATSAVTGKQDAVVDV